MSIIMAAVQRAALEDTLSSFRVRSAVQPSPGGTSTSFICITHSFPLECSAGNWKGLNLKGQGEPTGLALGLACGTA